jgi:L,D-transpeptidase YnhG
MSRIFSLLTASCFTLIQASFLITPGLISPGQAQSVASGRTTPPTSPKDLELPPLGNATGFLPDANQRNLRLVLDLSDRRVSLFDGDQVIASYPVAVGKPGWETPVGSFQITHKARNPIWENPFNGTVIPAGPGNPLGDRLMVFAKMSQGYAAFHGTTNESLIGQAVSHGCVRMRNRDIRALFEQVPIGTPVIVQR